MLNFESIATEPIAMKTVYIAWDHWQFAHRSSSGNLKQHQEVFTLCYYITQNATGESIVLFSPKLVLSQ
jgi:hypothetical protein